MLILYVPRQRSKHRPVDLALKMDPAPEIKGVGYPSGLAILRLWPDIVRFWPAIVRLLASYPSTLAFTPSILASPKYLLQWVGRHLRVLACQSAAITHLAYTEEARSCRQSPLLENANACVASFEIFRCRIIPVGFVVT
jgi:hypothetical protein